MTPVISVKDVDFTYQPAEVTALREINLEINKDEVTAIIGQNGSGKTTLVKHFNGLLKPTKGAVLVQGNDTKDLTTAKLSSTVGYVFQDPDDQLFMNKVYDEVAFGPKNLEFEEKELKKSVKEALKLVGLWSLRKKHPLDLNLNDKKFVTMASIIAMKPDVIVLDEPTNGQDHDGIKKVEELIGTLKKEHTVVLISHNMDLVSKVADRVVMMYDTRIIFNGPPEKAFTKNKLLSKTYLKPPAITQLAQSVKKMPRSILSIDDFVKELQKVSK